MDKRQKELTEDKLNAGRGVAGPQPTDTDNNTVPKEDKDDRPDDRARRAGY